MFERVRQRTIVPKDFYLSSRPHNFLDKVPFIKDRREKRRKREQRVDYAPRIIRRVAKFLAEGQQEEYSPYGIEMRSEESLRKTLASEDNIYAISILKNRWGRIVGAAVTSSTDPWNIPWSIKVNPVTFTDATILPPGQEISLGGKELFPTQDIPNFEEKNRTYRESLYNQSAHMHDEYIDKQYRGRGYSRRLLLGLEPVLREQGLLLIVTEARGEEGEKDNAARLRSIYEERVVADLPPLNVFRPEVPNPEIIFLQHPELALKEHLMVISLHAVRRGSNRV